MAKLSRSPRTPIATLPTGTNFLNIDANAYTSEKVDALLQALVSAGASNGTAIITGNDSPSPAGMVCAAILLSRDWTITSDCAIITVDTTFTVNEDGTWKIEAHTAGAGVTVQWQQYSGEWVDVGGRTAEVFDNPPAAMQGLNPEAYRLAVMRGATTVYTSPKTVDVPAMNGTSLQGGAIPGDLTDGKLVMELDTSSTPSPLPICYVPPRTDFQIYRDDVALDNDVGRVGCTGELTDGGALIYSDDNPTAGTYKYILTAPNGAKVATNEAVWTE